MKISHSVSLVIVLVCVLIAIVLIENGDKIFGSEPVSLVDIEVVNHSVYGNGYQITDRVKYRVCVVYPDALEPLNRLDCYDINKGVTDAR